MADGNNPLRCCGPIEGSPRQDGAPHRVAGFAHRYARPLSGGLQQRTAIARALANGLRIQAAQVKVAKEP